MKTRLKKLVATFLKNAGDFTHIHGSNLMAVLLEPMVSDSNVLQEVPLTRF